MQRNRFDRGSFVFGLCAGVVLTSGLMLAVFQPNFDAAPDNSPAPLAAIAPARECAIRAAYFTSTQDDWGQRALIASTVLNRASSPDVGIPCGLPPSPSSVGDPPNAYLWQSAVDAVDAVASGSYVVPLACTGAVEVVSSSAAPHARCVSGDLAFVAAL